MTLSVCIRRKRHLQFNLTLYIKKLAEKTKASSEINRRKEIWSLKERTET